MSSTTRPNGAEGVEFYYESDGTVTAKDLETGLARGGDTRADALAQLAEVIKLHEGDSEPVTDDDLEEMGIDPDDVGDKPLPEFML